MTDNIQTAASRILSAHLNKGSFPDRMLEHYENRGLLQEIVYGVLRWRNSLDWIIQELTSRPAPTNIHALLLTSIFRVLYMNCPKSYFAVNECVEAGKKTGGIKAGRFVNGVLRNALRNKFELLARISKQPPSIKYSCPDSLFDRWESCRGREETISLCKWNNRRAHTTLFFSAGRQMLTEYSNLLTQNGVHAIAHSYDPAHFLTLPTGCKVSELPRYKDGIFTIQDPATTCAVELLNAQPGEDILDACAAPGGKTLMIAAAMKNQGTLAAMDLYSDRLKRLSENIERMRMNFISVFEGDARGTPATPASYDGILLDVPCTNTGVIRRRPDVKWRFSDDRLNKVNETQKAILDHNANLVRTGGRMVYSTCSLEPEENEQLISQWLSTHPGFELIGSRLLFPPESQTDGAYAACLKKVKA